MFQEHARQNSSVFCLIDNHAAIDQNVINPIRIGVRIIFERIEMRIKIGGTIMDARKVKDDNIGAGPLPQDTAIQ